MLPRMRVPMLFLATSLLATTAHAAPIIGGAAGTVGQYPNVVVLEVGQGLCTGTLITKDWILTAAHCVTPSIVGAASQAALTASIKVHFGTVNLRLSQGTVVKASDSIPDPGFNGNNLGSHDSGLIKLATPVTNVMPVPINLVAADAPVGIKVTMVGFGATAINAGGNVGVEMVVDQMSMSCAGIGSDADLLCFNQSGGKGKCEGDSGGPSFAMVKGAMLQVGITSFGDQSCAQFGADTRTEAEQAFILQHVPELSCQKNEACNAACGINGLPADPDCPVCQTNADCTGDGQICLVDQCVLGPTVATGLGATCTENADCQSGSCATGSGGSMCTTSCTAEVPDSCPSGFDCLVASNGAGVCWETPSTGGGCSTGAGGGPVLLGLSLLGLAIARRKPSAR